MANESEEIVQSGDAQLPTPNSHLEEELTDDQAEGDQCEQRVLDDEP